MDSTDENPLGPGLPTGRQTASEQGKERTAEDVLDDAAAGRALDGADADLLTRYFLGDAPKPGTESSSVKTVDVDLAGEKKIRWKVRSIAWSTIQEARARGERTDGQLDEFVVSAWIVAAGTVEPRLGDLLARVQRQKPDGAPEHGPALLMDFFEKVPGSLLSLSSYVQQLSKLQGLRENVREVEAGKT